MNLSTVSDAILVGGGGGGGGKHSLKYSECMGILATSNHYKSFKV